MQIAARPVVAVSSTIYDFQDLRSALKFWLEELGFQVSLSEFNDFPKDVEKNSYEACLESIAKSDYFVLLIGNRSGGWFDEKQKISITRMEYRVAYDSFKKIGRPKPIVFVRQNLWDIREDRAALERFLRDIDHTHLTPAEQRAIVAHPSRFADNVDAIFSFLKEVGQVQQMKNAAAGGAALPPANWIHRFNTFREIVEALRIALGAISSVELRQLSANLKAELATVLSRLLEKGKDGKLFPRSNWGMWAVRSLQGGWADSSEMESKYLTWLGIFKLMQPILPKQLTCLFIEEAVRTGAFGALDIAKGTFQPTALSDALSQILAVIRGLQSATTPTPEELIQFVEAMKRYRARGQTVRVPNVDIVLTCVEAKTLDRLTELCRRCLRALSGDDKAFEGLPVFEYSILPNETPKLAEEAVFPNDAEAWAMH
jgi:hypothetical protein